ncbi:MAG: hypothetical protein GY869_25175, partial [Planctomycetes bacterium]|nr:hypothetical protein [Planctomycetota bacterium]
MTAPTRTDNCYHVVSSDRNGARAILDGFTITAGQGDGSRMNQYGGAMISDGGSPTLRNLTFLANSAASFGGAMYNYHTSLTIIANCTFEGNAAGLGGGGLYNMHTSSPVLTNCLFLNNRATNSGGAMYNRDNSEPDVLNCRFLSNSSGQYGGAIHSRDASSPYITQSTFSNNTSGLHGAGLHISYSATPVITQCTFVNNAAAANRPGGGIYNNSSASVEISNCILWDNEPNQITAGSAAISCCDINQDGYGNAAGAPDNNDNIRLDPLFCGVESNAFTLFNDSPCAAENYSICSLVGAWPVACQIRTWLVDPSGSGDFTTIQAAINAAKDRDIIELTDADFYGAGNNYINFLGKEITLRSQSGIPENCVINIDGDETVTSGIHFISSEGPESIISGVTITNGNPNNTSFGGILCDASSPTIHNCIINGNDSITGGGINCINSSSPIITDCAIGGNTAEGGGGGIYCNYGSSPTITNCTISYNQALSGGGIYCNNSSSPVITDSDILNNDVTMSGGGIYCENGSSPIVKNSHVNINTSTYGGGVFCRNSANIELTGSFIRNNISNLSGGGLYIIQASPDLTGCTISGNQSIQGGGLYCDEGSNPEIISCIIIDNKVEDEFDGNGGGLFFAEGSTPAITESFIENNSSSTFGGGIFCQTSAAVVTRSSIKGNITQDSGGGIYCYQSSPQITDCIIQKNEALRGGGIACEYSASPTITRCAITRNKYDTGGGLFCREGSSPLITSSVISYNHPLSDDTYTSGGGIYCSSGSAPNIIACTISNNLSNNYCGGIAFSSEDGAQNITGSIIWDNSPTEICSVPDNPTVFSFCNIKNSGGSGSGWNGSLGVDGGHNIDLDPLLGAGAHLQAGSPCIDAINTAEIPPALPGNDLDLEARPHGGGYDIGADEFIDSDDDGLPDYWEEDWFGHYNQTGTSNWDNDGLNELEEFIYGASPKSPDTDEDGVTDGVEVAQGTDPVDAADYPTMPDYYVAPWGDDESNHGFSPTSPLATIQRAIHKAEATHVRPAVIHVAAGTYFENLIMEAYESIEGAWNSDFSQRWDFVTNGPSPDIEYESIIDASDDYEYLSAIYLTDLQGNLSIDGFKIQGGWGEEGGGVYCNNSSSTITNCVIFDNLADLFGAGIYCINSSMNITHTVFSNNLSYSMGGGLSCIETSLTMEHCSFVDNQAGAGAGLALERNCLATIHNSHFSENDATNMGGAILFTGTVLTLNGCNLTNNSITGDFSEDNGGGLSAAGDGLVEIIGCNLIGNTTEGTNNNGGGIYGSTNLTLTIEDSTISNNLASKSGGGIYCTDNTSLTATNSSFIDNMSSSGGGGIYCDENSPLKILNCDFRRNIGYSTGGGGVLVRGGSTSFLKNCIFSNNEGGADGGGLYISESSSTVINCTFSGNKVDPDYNTAGIYCYQSPLTTIKNSILWANNPVEITSSGSLLQVTDSNILGGYFGQGNIDENPLFAGPE